MTPNYQTDNITLYRGDCLEVMAELERQGVKVDAVITDPPYLTTDLHFDKAGVKMQVFTHLLNITQNNGYLACFAPVEMQAKLADIWAMRFSGAWVKPRPSMRTHSAKKPMNQWELYCVFANPLHKTSLLTWNKLKYQSGKPYKRIMTKTDYKRGGKDQIDRANATNWGQAGYVSESNGERFCTDVLRGSSKTTMAHSERTDHPTQKPLDVMVTLVGWLTNPGDLVIDPFMGSGTTGLACAKLGRKFIGVEIDPDYYQIAEDRIRNAAGDYVTTKKEKEAGKMMFNFGGE